MKYGQRTYDNIYAIRNGQGHDYTSGCLLNYRCFNRDYRLTAIDLGKQQPLDIDPKTITQVNFTEYLDVTVMTKIFPILEQAN